METTILSLDQLHEVCTASGWSWAIEPLEYMTGDGWVTVGTWGAEVRDGNDRSARANESDPGTALARAIDAMRQLTARGRQ